MVSITDAFWIVLAAYDLWLFAEGIVCLWEGLRGNFYDEQTKGKR